MSSEKSTPSEIYRLVDSFIPALAWDATVAIVAATGTTLYQFGTGTLFRVADESFVVTAAHVPKVAEKKGLRLCITGVDGFIPLPRRWIGSADQQYGTNSDPFDVAVVQLGPDCVQKLTAKVFLRFDDIISSDDLTSGVFTVFGYPACWSRPSGNRSEVLELKPLQYTTYAFEGDTDALEEYQQRFHLLLSAAIEETSEITGNPVAFSDRQGLPARFPGDLGGISGSSVWKIGDRATPIRDWKSRAPKLVGVQIGVYHRKKIIKATRWIAVSTLLHEAFPALRPAMSLWRF